MPIAVHAVYAKRLSPMQGPMLPRPIERPAAKSCNPPLRSQTVGVLRLMSNAIKNPKMLGVMITVCVSNMSCKILLLKNGWRATDKQAACAGRLEAMPATKPVRPIASVMPILPSAAYS